MKKFTRFLQIALFAMFILGLNACGILVPINATETIKIDDSDTALVRTEGKFINLFPIFRVIKKYDPKMREKFSPELNSELGKAFIDEVLKAHKERITSHHEHSYQVVSESLVPFEPLDEQAEEPERTADDLLRNVTMSMLFKNHENQRVVLFNANNAKELLDPNKEPNPSREAIKEQIKNDLKEEFFQNSLYTFIIETNQQVIRHNAQKQQKIEGTDQIRYEWQFPYEMMINSDDVEKRQLIDFVLEPSKTINEGRKSQPANQEN